MAEESGNKSPWIFDLQSFSDFSKLFSRFNVPGVNLSAIVDSRRMEIEALVDANRSIYEAMQAICEKQTEMLSQGIQEIARGDIGDSKKSVELVQAACQKALDDMMELVRIAQSAQAEATARISGHATATMQEIRDMMNRQS
jgi:DNA replication initiation complex subunit (GINS family)